jgi:hypothetical protein
MAKKVSAKKKRLHKPPLFVDQILAWAKAHHERTGRWPHARSGPIEENPGENWQKIGHSLRFGLRGLPGGSSLPALLEEQFGIQRGMSRPALTINQVLAWMQEHRRLTGQWPKIASGAVQSAPSENWKAIDNALRYGFRGLPAGLSLRRLRRKQGWR